MIQGLTPEELIQERVAAFRRRDFSAIFASYHPDAPFFRFFPDCESYLSHAAEEISDSFRIESCQILRSRFRGEFAEILFRQRLIYQGEVRESLEIARCRQDQEGRWRFVAGLRLDPQKVGAEPLPSSWDLLVAAGDDLWI